MGNQLQFYGHDNSIIWTSFEGECINGLPTRIFEVTYDPVPLWKRRSRTHLSLPLFLGPANDLFVGVSHHGDEHVDQKDRYKHGERDEHGLRQRRQLCKVELFILNTPSTGLSQFLML